MSNVPELPEKIGKYEILGIAGRGAMGVVYHGYDPFFDREVAIKITQVLSEASSAHAVARKMLITEAQAAGNLDHGAIVEVLDLGEFEGEPYVVMEYVAEARTLREHCFADNLMPQEHAVALVYHCARALDHAHQHGVIHRDIKPSNILLTADDQAKIGDFGLATIASLETTIILGAAGSPRYMSPEQFMEMPLTQATDLYSLGVVLYELLTGVPTFKSRNFVDLAREVTTTMPPLAHEQRAQISPVLSAVVMRAINKRPSDRFASGAEFADALASVYGELDHSSSFLTAKLKFQLARDLSFFEHFSDAELREFVQGCIWQCFANGERIVREGNMERTCHILVSGEVALSKGGQRIATLRRGSCFGEMGFLSRGGRSATVHARGEATVMTVDVDAVSNMSSAVQERFNQHVVGVVVERLASTTERLSKFLSGTSV